MLWSASRMREGGRDVAKGAARGAHQAAVTSAPALDSSDRLSNCR